MKRKQSPPNSLPQSPPSAPSDATQDPIAAIQADFDRRLAETDAHLSAILALWSPLVQLTDAERAQGIGRVIFTMGDSIKGLFTQLVPRPDWTDVDRKLAANFDHLGDQDGGVDPERFEPIPLLGLFERMARLATLRERLLTLERQLGDDQIHHGQVLSTVGLLAVGHARSLSEGNAAFRSKLAPLLNQLSQMTRDARKASATAKAAVPAVTPDADKPKP